MTDEIRVIITDQINRHVAMTEAHRAWLIDDIATRIEHEVVGLAADKARLDWIEERGDEIFYTPRGIGESRSMLPTRSAIDAKMLQYPIP